MNADVLEAAWWGIVFGRADIADLASVAVVCSAWRGRAQQDELTPVLTEFARIAKYLRRPWPAYKLGLLRQPKVFRVCETALEALDAALTPLVARRCNQSPALPIYELARRWTTTDTWDVSLLDDLPRVGDSDHDDDEGDALMDQIDEDLGIVRLILSVHAKLQVLSDVSGTEHMDIGFQFQIEHRCGGTTVISYGPGDHLIPPLPVSVFSSRVDSAWSGAGRHASIGGVFEAPSWRARGATTLEPPPLMLEIALEYCRPGDDPLAGHQVAWYKNNYETDKILRAVATALGKAEQAGELEFKDGMGALWLFQIPCSEMLGTRHGLGIIWDALVTAHDAEIGRLQLAARDAENQLNLVGGMV